MIARSKARNLVTKRYLLRLTIVRTRFGKFVLKASDRGLYSLEFPGRRNPRNAKSYFRSTDKVSCKKAQNALSSACRALQKYFSGKPVSFCDIPVDYRGATFFGRKVLNALRSVKLGETCTYAELARKSGAKRACRAVGNVMRKNRLPIILPCHRVIQATGRFGKYSAGRGWKKRLLALEGLSA